MGRSGGCCNFQHSANCTAPPCPIGSCCYVNNIFFGRDDIGIDGIIEQYKCEENLTENCCLSKPFSFFNEGVTSCGEIELCSDQSSLVIPTVFNTDKAFALLKHNGSVVAWGDSATGGSAPSDLSDVIEIFSNPVAFVALKKDGTAVPWGDASKGGSFLPTFIPGEDPDTLDNIKSVTGSFGAFAALKTDGTVIAWGDATYGGVIPSRIKNLLVDIAEVVSTDRYFAARSTNGEIFIWGNGAISYDKFDVNKDGSITAGDALFVNNRLLDASYHSAADVDRSGGVTALDALLVSNQIGQIPPYDSGFTNVKKIYSNKHAFAFLKNDGSVFVWGDENKGGNTGINQQYLTNVKEIYNTDQAFLAHREDNKIVVWGDIQTTAGPNSSFYSEVLEVFPSKYAFGLSYIVQEEFIALGAILKLTQYFDVIGSVAPGKQNLAQRAYFGDRNRISRYPEDLNSTKIEVSLDFFSSYSGPFDPEDPPLNIDGRPYAIKRNFYASQYAFHFYEPFDTFYSIGNSPDNEHNSHNLKGDDSTVGNFISNNYYFLSNIKEHDNRDEFYFNNTPVKNGASYVSTKRATAFLVDYSNKVVRDVFIPRNSPAQGLNYVVSLGHSSYGGVGTTFNERQGPDGFQIIPPVGAKGYFKGLFSNEHAFCGIRFASTEIIGDSDDNINLGGGRRIYYDIITWGDANFGGESSDVDFSNTFANTKDLRYTYEGCHPNYCDQDIT
jgi:hypothetical protein